MKHSIKRVQSQAGLSFAEREDVRPKVKQKLLFLLVLLLTATTGAWAQEETLLTTITATGQTTYSESTAGVVTVSHDNDYFDNTFGWLWYEHAGSVTVEAKDGYTITRCVFSQPYKTPFTVSTAPFKVDFIETSDPEMPEFKQYLCQGYMDGVSSIEVYGYAPAAAPATYSVSLAEGTEDFDKWTISPTEAAEDSPVTATYSGEKKVKSVKAVKKGGAVDPKAVPLTIEAITPGIISVTNPKAGMQYSLDGGATKNAVTTDQIMLAAGDKVQFYGNGTSITSYGGSSTPDCTYINGKGSGFTCKVYGNIMSLVDEENFATAKTLSATYTFANLFNGNTALTDASGLLLPATQLAAYCYYNMFQYCTALTAAPALPATQLAEYCYYDMFQNCTALTAAPELPATQLAERCYYYMFSGCTALTTAPALPATQLAAYCYYYMFQNCTALTAAPALPATQLASSCYHSMFRGCSALTAAPELPATQLANSCYYQMFRGCSKLATVTCLATSGISQSNTYNWLYGAGTEVEDTKTVYTSSSASWSMNNTSGIPSGWTRVNVDN